MKLENISDIRDYLKGLLKDSTKYEFVASLFIEDLEGVRHKIESAERNSIKGRIRLFSEKHKPYELVHLNIKSVIDNLKYEACLSNFRKQNAVL